MLREYKFLPSIIFQFTGAFNCPFCSLICAKSLIRALRYQCYLEADTGIIETLLVCLYYVDLIIYTKELIFSSAFVRLGPIHIKMD